MSKILSFALCLSLTSYFWQTILSVGPRRTDEDHAFILNKLRTTFREIRHTNQFAVLYVPPPNAPRRQVNFVPRRPEIETGDVIYPPVTSDNRFIYPFNYAGSTVDHRGLEYRDMLQRPRNRDIHTEDLSLNLVYPGLVNWYAYHFDRQPREIYLYTYFLPCRRCFEIIRQFVEATRARLVVGYTQLYGGVREGENTTLQSETRRRRDHLQNFMNNNNGSLLQISADCSQVGSDARVPRDTSGTCSDVMFVIAMDFSDGKAKAWFSLLDSDNDGWIAVLDVNGNRKTYEYTYGEMAGGIKFNTYISTGMFLVYHWSSWGVEQLYHTYRWNNCGFGSTKLNKLPYSIRYPGFTVFSQIRIEMVNGEAKVIITLSPHYIPNRSDFVAFESLANIGTRQYITYQWLSRFTAPERNVRYYSFSLSSATANGFRAKYVYYNGVDYQYEDVYDNASPIWTPGGCQGGAM